MKLRLLSSMLAVLATHSLAAGADDSIELLFLGDRGHHQPAARAEQLIPVLAKRGINITYTESVNDLNSETLGKYDGLLVYANIDEISPSQEQALLQYVEAGNGFIPLHCASFCFRNSEKYVALVGAQFQRHGGESFRTRIVGRSHPIMQGFDGFESWDETYVHTKHNETHRTVLSYRVDSQGREPWTWVRTHGKGRVFYTAWGHDARTWGEPGFQNLIERGIRWAIGADPGDVPSFKDPHAFPIPAMTPKRMDVQPFEYTEAKVPFYPPSATWGKLAEPLTKMQKPLPAEESLKHMVVPVGFEVKLFASEPDLRKPICMTWDERGRLWCGETIDYPNELKPEGEGRDSIKICQDTDGDGRADKFTVFADKLSIPTTITFHRGGVIVQDGTKTWYMKDNDGDDVADEKRVLFDGWNMRDTHGGVSNFQYGLDNWIWAMQGYNNSSPTVDGEADQSFRMGFFRFKPDGSELEFIRSTNNNTWGLGISEEGIVFGSTANRNPSVYMPIPNRYYEKVRGWSPSQLGTIADTHLFEPITENVRQVDHHNGYTAGAGHALYTARTYPEEYWNRVAFVCGPTGHLVGSFVITRDGASFKSTSPFNLLASDDEWSAPVMAEVGPDGNVWVLDWYNCIVQHNPTPAGYKTGQGNAYKSELRDKRHARIYRIVYRGSASEKNAAPRLRDVAGEELVAALKHPNMFWRRHAQRLLVERGKRDVVPDLIELIDDRGFDQIGLNPRSIHALWTLKGLGALHGDDAEANKAVIRALQHPSPGVRQVAVAVSPRTESMLKALLARRVAVHADPQVRLATFLALSEFWQTNDLGLLIDHAIARRQNHTDSILLDALTVAAAAHAPSYLAAVLGEGAWSERPVAHGLPQVRELTRRVAEHFARGAGQEQIKELLALRLDSRLKTELDDVSAGLAAGWPQEEVVVLDRKTEAGLVAWVKQATPAAQANLVSLGSRWGSKKLEAYVLEIAAAFTKQVQDESLSEAERLAAANQLIEFRGTDGKAVVTLLDVITPRTTPALSEGLFAAIGKSESTEAGIALVQRLSSLTPKARASSLRVLLSRKEWTAALVDALAVGRIPLGDLALEQKQALTAHPNRQIAAKAKAMLSRGGGLPNADRQKVIDEMLPLTKLTGNVAAGKAVFKKTCEKCHTHSGEGTKIGPDLTGMAVHPKHELLIHILDPSRSVEGNYRIYTVVTESGKVLSGLLAAESRTALELIDVEGKKHIIVRDEIDELVSSKKSLMPDGVEKQHTPQDLTDLLEFLTQREKFIPIPLDKYATIASTQGMFFTKEGPVERLIFPDWSPKTFEGVPFYLVDPKDDRAANVIMLHGPRGNFPPRMPNSVTLPCNTPAKAIHFLSGVSGWGFPAIQEKSVSMIVRLKYADGEAEDHPLRNAVHFADYIRRVDVPESKLAFMLRSQQIRYLAIYPKRSQAIGSIELVKGPDQSAPIVMAVTIEGH